MHAFAWPAPCSCGCHDRCLRGFRRGRRGDARSRTRRRFRCFRRPSLLNCLKPSPGRTEPRSHRDRRSAATSTTGRPSTWRASSRTSRFDLFTIQHSPQTATGTPDANPSVGLGVVPDRSASRTGTDTAKRAIRTVLLDQIFGVDKDVCAAARPTRSTSVSGSTTRPTPANCGFTGSTPFNGEHDAGPLAFVTRPNATTNLGPLCTDPISAGGGTFTCNP